MSDNPTPNGEGSPGPSQFPPPYSPPPGVQPPPPPPGAFPNQPAPGQYIPPPGNVPPPGAMPPPGAGGFQAPPPPPSGDYGFTPPSYGAPGYGYDSTQPQLANYGYRVGGYVIDVIILGIIFFIIVGLTHGIHTTAATPTTPKKIHIDTGVLLIEPLLTLVYGTVLLGSSWGQTIGMKLVGIRVVKAADGSQIDYGKAFVRSIVAAAFGALQVVTVVLGLVALLDLLWPLWDKQNQTLHDKAAGTVVIKL